ncbi:MAG TPA: ATP-dependent sacrificial sulfur transferase LarE [Anaerolineales bacterium]|nr:ATP-dependent sacrificial sulfur transferase LarE [Anaerolineales bacterium]
MTTDTNNKVEQIQHMLRQMGSLVVAYSGGIDSTLMLKIAHDTLGERALGIMAVSASLPELEQQQAVDIARGIGARLKLIHSDETSDERYLKNAPDRCYFCKSNVYDQMVAYAQEHGYTFIVDGTNADDQNDHRPGREAARERGVRSPLLEYGVTKKEIRQLARAYGLPNWDKPAAACLASRIPYGTMITIPMLSQIERAELALREMGFVEFRVRHHDQIARIEVEAADFPRLIDQREGILAALKMLGYTYVTLDLAGFRSGSMNEVLLKNGKRKAA